MTDNKQAPFEVADTEFRNVQLTTAPEVVRQSPSKISGTVHKRTTGTYDKPRQMPVPKSLWIECGRNVVFVSSIIVSIISGAIGLGGLAGILSGHSLKGGVVGNVGAMIFFTAITILFASIAKHQHKQAAALTELERERAVLAYAKQEGRELTIPEVALHASLRITDAGDVLNRLTARGVCQMDVSEDGELLYCFTSFKKHTPVMSQQWESLDRQKSAQEGNL